MKTYVIIVVATIAALNSSLKLGDPVCTVNRINYCIKYADADRCTACLSDRYPDSDGKCLFCSKVIEDCNTCTVDTLGNTTCERCNWGKIPSQTGMECIRCYVSGCKTCSADGVCSSCTASNESPTADGSSCEAKPTLTCDVDGCKVCSADGVCSDCPACNEDPTADESTCEECSNLITDRNTCIIRESVTSCYKCSKGKYPSLDGSECLECATAIPDCADCFIDVDGIICRECTVGYLARNGLSCVKCDIDGCESCSADGICVKCADTAQYISDDGRFCKSCSSSIPGCNSCTEDNTAVTCNACDYGKLLTKNGSECTACSNYIPECNSCTKDNDVVTCNACDYGNVPTPDGSECIACSKFFADCSSCTFEGTTFICNECDNGKYLKLDGSQCTDCETVIPGCDSCKAGISGTLCLGCKTRQVASDGKSCVNCDIQNCNECIEDNVCSSCSGSRRPNSHGTACITCDIQNCYECNRDNVCSFCSGSNMIPNSDGTACIGCGSAIPKCTECRREVNIDKSTCTSCTRGNIVSSDGSRCYDCESEIANCTACRGVYGGYVKCTECISGTFPSENGALCYTCADIIPNCGACSINQDGTYCESCSDGYYLVRGSCCGFCTIENCLKCNLDGTCEVCGRGMQPSYDGSFCNASSLGKASFFSLTVIVLVFLLM